MCQRSRMAEYWGTKVSESSNKWAGAFRTSKLATTSWSRASRHAGSAPTARKECTRIARTVVAGYWGTLLTGFNPNTSEFHSRTTVYIRFPPELTKKRLLCCCVLYTSDAADEERGL